MTLQVWKIEYEGGFTSRGGGAQIVQRITEWLLVTPHALVKYKVCRNKDGAHRVRMFTDVQSQGRLLDVGALKRHNYYRSMHRAAGGSPLKAPELLSYPDVRFWLDQYPELEELIKADEKAQNALMTAMGHNGELTLGAIIEQAKVETKVQRDVKLQQKALVMADEDPLWRMF
jgi:hypothetical protein